MRKTPSSCPVLSHRDRTTHSLRGARARAGAEGDSGAAVLTCNGVQLTQRSDLVRSCLPMVAALLHVNRVLPNTGQSFFVCVLGLGIEPRAFVLNYPNPLHFFAVPNRVLLKCLHRA